MNRLGVGERAGDAGVRFVFVPSLPDLQSGTSSEPPGFYWRWLLIGTLVIRGLKGPEKSEGGLLIGTHLRSLHALSLPERGSDFRYQFGDEDTVVAEIRDLPIGKGIFGKKKPVKGLLLQVTPDLAVMAAHANELSPVGDLVREGCEEDIIAAISNSLY